MHFSFTSCSGISVLKAPLLRYFDVHRRNDHSDFFSVLEFLITVVNATSQKVHCMFSRNQIKSVSMNIILSETYSS